MFVLSERILRSGKGWFYTSKSLLPFSGYFPDFPQSDILWAEGQCVLYSCDFFIIFSCCKTFSMSSSLLFLRRTAPQVASLYIFPPCTAIPSRWNATLAPCRQALGPGLPLTSSSPPAVTAGCGHKVCWVNSAGAVYCTVFFSFTWTNKRKR